MIKFTMYIFYLYMFYHCPSHLLHFELLLWRMFLLFKLLYFVCLPDEVRYAHETQSLYTSLEEKKAYLMLHLQRIVL